MSTTIPAPPDVVRRRYAHIAPWFPIFEVVFWLPPGMRRKAVDLLRLEPGDRVLEVGCGTGRNLGLLVAAVGPEGRVHGVDLSEAMLARCEALRAARGWRNLTLVRADASEYDVPEPADGVLFSLSYAVMRDRREILRRACLSLKPGGRLVIFEGGRMRGPFGAVLRPVVDFMMKATVLGDADHTAADDLAALAGQVEVREYLMGGYMTCRAVKPGPERAQSAAPRPSP